MLALSGEQHPAGAGVVTRVAVHGGERLVVPGVVTVHIAAQPRDAERRGQRRHQFAVAETGDPQPPRPDRALVADVRELRIAEVSDPAGLQAGSEVERLVGEQGIATGVAEDRVGAVRPARFDPDRSMSRAFAPVRSMTSLSSQRWSLIGTVMTPWPRSSVPVIRVPTSRTAAIRPASAGSAPSTRAAMTSARITRAPARGFPVRSTIPPRGNAAHRARSGALSILTSTRDIVLTHARRRPPPAPWSAVGRARTSPG
jgi:hypothetical protein